MQNHVDSSLARQPGYRDRIVHVHTAPDEGGMNLTMPPELIRSLTLRGQAAGRALVERFAETPGTDPGLSWDNHRWVRYRSALAALAELLEQLAAAWREDPEGERSYRELVERGDDVGPNGYRFTSEAQRQLALTLTELLAEAGERAERGPGERDTRRAAAGVRSRGSSRARDRAQRTTQAVRSGRPTFASASQHLVVRNGVALVGRHRAPCERGRDDAPVAIDDRAAGVPALHVAAQPDHVATDLDAPVRVARRDRATCCRVAPASTLYGPSRGSRAARPSDRERGSQAGAAAPRGPGTRTIARSFSGVEGDDAAVAGSSRRRGRSTGDATPATTCAFVTTRPAADDPARALDAEPARESPAPERSSASAARTSGSRAIAGSGGSTPIAGPAIDANGSMRPTASITRSGGTASVSAETTVDSCASRRSSLWPGT